MTITSQKRYAWVAKFARLTASEKAAREAVLVAVHEAVESGLSQADITRMLGLRPGAYIGAKAAKGKAILEGRRKA